MRYIKKAAVTLCLLLLICFFCEPLSIKAEADDLSSLQNQANSIKDRIAVIEAEKSKIQASINETKSQLEKERATKAYLDQQIAYTKEEIQSYEDLIANLMAEIELKQLDIDEKQAEHDENYALFRQRLQAMYMFGDASTLGLLFGTDSFVDFLSKNDTISRVADHDRQLMEMLTAQKMELLAQGEELNRRKEEQEKFKQTAQEKRDTLQVQTEAAAIKIQDVSDLQSQFTADLAKAQAESAAMSAELNEVYRKIEWSKNPYIGGVMRWPVDNFPKISSYYGPRFGGSDFHTGIDIYGSGIYNQPVRAANAGTVRVANWSYTPGRGYGIYVLIDHGGKVSTLYAHMCNITVNVGDVVSQGQQIGNVGSTGWSTGPHLHFEIREDGKHKDPLGYLKG